MPRIGNSQALHESSWRYEINISVLSETFLSTFDANLGKNHLSLLDPLVVRQGLVKTEANWHEPASAPDGSSVGTFSGILDCSVRTTEEGWENRKAERQRSLGVADSLALRPRDWRSRRQYPRRSQEFLITWELTQVGHASLGTLDVDPSDDAAPIDQELSDELGRMV